MTDDSEPNLALRHTFPAGTIADAGQVVVFGGGPHLPTNFGGAVVQTASEDNGGVALVIVERHFTSKIYGLTVLSQAMTDHKEV